MKNISTVLITLFLIISCKQKEENKNSIEKIGTENLTVKRDSNNSVNEINSINIKPESYKSEITIDILGPIDIFERRK